MATLTKERARAPIATNKTVWTNLRFRNGQMLYCISVSGDDDRIYELELSVTEMLKAVSEWTEKAAKVVVDQK